MKPNITPIRATKTLFMRKVLSRTRLTTLFTLLSMVFMIPQLSVAQTTIFSENMGTPSGNTAIATYATGTAPATFQNKGTLTYGIGGQTTTDVRTSSASTTYSGASGNGNVFFTSTSGSYGFAIESIDASAYTSLSLNFGYRKESASVHATFSVDYWDGSAWQTIANTSANLFNEASNAAVGWYLSKSLSLPAGAQISTLKIRFVKSGAASIRIDDVKLTGTLATPSIALNNTSFAQIASDATPLPGATNVVLGKFRYDVTTAAATLNSVALTTAGTYQAADLTNFKLYYSSTTTMPGSALATVTSIPATGATLTFSSLAQAISSGASGYFWVTADIAPGATSARTVGLTSSVTGTFALGTPTGSVTTPTLQTITAAAQASVAYSNTAIGSSNLVRGNQAIIQQFKLDVTSVNATINSLSILTSGTYRAADINFSSGTSGIALWYNASSYSLAGATRLGSFQSSTSTGSGDIITFSGLSQAITAGSSGYFLITADIASGATLGRTIGCTSIGLNDITYSATVNKSGSIAASGTITLTDIAPTLTAAVGATVDGAFEVTFTESATWRGAITGITVGGVSLAGAAYSTTTAGKIIFTPSASTLLQTPGSKSIVVTATNFTNATVSQSIAVGAAAKLSVTTQPTAPATNGAVLAVQPIVAVLDQYNNATTSGASITATATSGLWTIGGTATVSAINGTATFAGLTAGHTAAVTGATITFTSAGLTSAVSGTFDIAAPDFVSLTAIGTAYTQNFNSLGTSGTATLPQGFKITSGAAPTFSNVANTSATTLTYGTAGTGLVGTSGGAINWAVGATDTATDRALGFLSTGTYTSPRGIILKMKNTTGSSISSLSVSYDYEKYRFGSRQFDFTFFVSTDGTNWTSNTSGDQTYAADANSTTVNNPPTSISKSFAISGVNIANGSDYYIRWQYTGLSGSTNGQGLGIDNLSVTPVNPSINTSGSLTAFTTTYGIVSTEQSFTVSGTSIQAGGITITAPTGFEVSLTSGSGFGASANISGTGTVASTTVYVRLKANAAVTGTYNSVNFTVASSGITTVNIPTTATGNAVSAKTLTITADNDNKAYGDVLTSGTGKTAFSSVGLVNGESIGTVTLTYGSGAAALDAIATYTGSIVPSAATGGTFTASNYSISYVAGNIIVSSAASITVNGTLSALSTTYGTASSNTSFTVEGAGLQGNITITPPAGFQVSTSATFVSNVGTNSSPLVLTQSGGNVNNTTVYVRLLATASVAGSPYSGNISVSSPTATTVTLATASSTVSRKDLTITATDVSKTFGATLTGASGSTAFTSSGLVNGETIGTVTISYGTGAAAIDNVATYAGSVTPSAAIGGSFTAGNYTITYATGAIIVNKASATITFGALTSVTTAASPITLTATASSAATVSYVSSNTGVATVSGTTVTIVGAGSTVITASAPSTDNFNAPTNVTQTLVVTYPVLAGWNFTAGTATASSASVSNLTVGALSGGNTNGTATLVTSTSASTTYTGASGTNNAGIPAPVIASNTSVNTASNGYFQFTLTPATGYTISLTDFSFGTRSTSTAPAAYTLRSSVDNYATSIASGTMITSPSTWELKSNNSLTFVTPPGEAVTFRLYGFNGTGSPSANTTNWRIDDITLNGFMTYNPTPVITPSVSTLATAFTQTSSTPSTVQSYTITGDFLDADVVVTPPAGFEISKSAGSGFTTGSLTYTRNGANNITGQPATVFVRMNTSTYGVNTGNITHTSTGAVTKNVSLTGTRTAVYYSKATGSLASTSTWGIETNGTGQAPSDFISAGMVYQVRNRTAVTLDANWVVSGSSSKVVIGDGSSVTDLTIPSNFTLTGTVDINNNGELTIENTTAPTIGTLATGSTLEYNNVAVTVPQITYSNLKLSGTGTKTFIGHATNATIISGNLTLSNVTIDGPSSSPFATISLGGNLTYVGTVTPPVDANSITLSTNGTAGGTQTITGAGNTVRWFRITTTTANTILMSTVGGSSNITVGNATSGGITLANSSVLNLNGNDLTFANVGGAGGASFILNTSGSISATASSDFNLFRSLNTSMGTIRFTSNANTVGNFTLNHTGTTNDLIVGSNFNITGSLTLTDGTLNLSTGNITLKSTATTQALVPALGAGAAITYGTGKFVVERYIPKGLRAFRDLTPSVSGAGSIFANWQENGSFLGSFGTYVTGKAATKTFAEAKAATGFVDATTGLDLSASGSKSIFTYNNTNGTWNPGLSSSKDTALTAMKGYRVLVRGDRNWSMYLIPQANDMINATTLRATGSLITGTQTISGLNTAANGFSLVGNPYVAPIDWLLVPRTNINPTIWILSPKTRAYVTVGTAGVVTPSGGGHNINQYIQPGQAFFVQTAAAGAASIQIEEADKVGSANVSSVFGAEAGTTSLLRIGLYKPVESVTLDMVDETVAVFGNYSNAVTGDDSYKMENPADNIMLVNGSQKLAIEARQSATANDVLPIELSKLSNNTNYQLKIDASGYTGTGFDAYVKDAYKKTETLVKSGAETAIDFTVDNTIPASYSNRFTVVFKPSVLPISSIDVQGVQQGSDVVLTINTVGERNISNYDVEKSTDGVAYSKLATVAAKNTATASYSVTDTKPVNGSNYYRVKVNGINEATTYSKVVIVKKAAAAAKYVLYPNPSKGNNVGLLLTQVNSGKYTITLRNVLGQQVHTEVVDHKGGNATIALRLKQVVANGQYTLSVSSDSNKQVVYQTNLLIQ